jgi:hypothetical protein
MDDTQYRRPVEDLDAALASLDRELTARGVRIEIKAIGGYALLKYGIRPASRAFTVDIDSVTRDYSRIVTEAIEKVAAEQNLAPNWLNNDNVLDDPEIVEEMIGARWIPQNAGYESIDFSTADVPTLTRSKIIAAADAEFSGRDNDVQDLFALAQAQGLKNLEQFRAKYPDQFGEYDAAYLALKREFSADYRRRFPELSQPNQRRPGLAEPVVQHER